MILRALELSDMEPIRKWRNECLDTLRTPFPLTKEQQEDWYKTEICNRNSRSRFWGIVDNVLESTLGLLPALIGYGGLENIQWENSIAEISLLIAPEYQNKGFGYIAVKDIIAHGFQDMGLHTIYGECYCSNPAFNFWAKLASSYVILPRRKYLHGHFVDSMYFTIIRPEA